jgi:hypothetical protein
LEFVATVNWGEKGGETETGMLRSEGNCIISHSRTIAQQIITTEIENVWCQKLPNIFVGKYFNVSKFRYFD